MTIDKDSLQTACYWEEDPRCLEMKLILISTIMINIILGIHSAGRY